MEKDVDQFVDFSTKKTRMGFPWKKVQEFAFTFAVVVMFGFFAVLVLGIWANYK